jgi:hypothetical protein
VSSPHSIMTNFRTGQFWRAGDGHDDERSPVLYRTIHAHIIRPVFYSSVAHCDGSKIVLCLMRHQSMNAQLDWPKKTPLVNDKEIWKRNSKHTKENVTSSKRLHVIEREKDKY